MNKQKKKSQLQKSNTIFLNETQKHKCLQKFQSYKALGCSMLSKNQLKRVLSQLGKQISEQQLYQMIYQADPHGHGYISYQSFEKIVKEYKQKKEENIYQPISLTFDQILQQYALGNKTSNHKIPLKYIELYLEDNFGLKVDFKNFKTLYNKSQLTRQDFKIIFS